MKTFAILFVLTILGVASILLAADTQPASKPVTQPASSSQPATSTQAALQPIRYERTGGFPGSNDVIEITDAGAVVVQGRLMGNGKGQLKPDQIATLIPLFAQWKTLQDSYPAPAGSADGFQLKIRYGGNEVSANELNESLPISFTAVHKALEQIARDITGK